MLVYRISSARYADDLAGEGARLFGGRWNHAMVPCIYTSASRALAIMEYSANVNLHDIPRALSIVTFSFPDALVREVPEADLPGNWRRCPAPMSTRDFGSRLLTEERWPVIKIPSVLIPEEFNFLLNPLPGKDREYRIEAIDDFVYDLRIKKERRN